MRTIVEQCYSAEFSQQAAIYARMSTDFQKYSIENQIIAIKVYAEQKRLEIVDVYADAGKSGLTYHGRHALKRLIQTVQSGDANFGNVLVLDVSRWGRFQDPDEGAYYEYICRKAGIQIHYVAEEFHNDGTSISSIIKTLKRIMAAEYSRELSSKVASAKARYASFGYHQGGIPRYALRRQVYDFAGNKIKILGSNERKGNLSHRSKVIPGPEHEIKILRWIFETYAKGKHGCESIAEILNNRGIKTHFGRDWTPYIIRTILKEEAYIGHFLYAKKITRLNRRAIKKSRQHWIRVENAIQPIIEPKLFYKVKRRMEQYTKYVPKDVMLSKLKSLLKRKGELSYKLIDDAAGMPSAGSYSVKFGGLKRIYQILDYKPRRKIDIAAKNIKKHLGFIRIIENHIFAKMKKAQVDVKRLANTPRRLSIGNGIIISCMICYWAEICGKRGRTCSGSLGTKNQCTDWIIVVRLNIRNTHPVKYYLVPSNVFRDAPYRVIPQWDALQTYELRSHHSINARLLRIVEETA